MTLASFSKLCSCQCHAIDSCIYNYLQANAAISHALYKLHLLPWTHLKVLFLYPHFNWLPLVLQDLAWKSLYKSFPKTTTPGDGKLHGLFLYGP